MDSELRALAEAARSASGVADGAQATEKAMARLERKQQKRASKKKKQQVRLEKEKEAGMFGVQQGGKAGKKTTANERKRLKKAKREAALARNCAAAGSSSNNNSNNNDDDDDDGDGDGASAAPYSAAAVKPFTGKRVFFGDREDTTAKYDKAETAAATSASNAPSSSSSSSSSSSTAKSKYAQPTGNLGHSNSDSALWFDNAPVALAPGQVKAKVSFQVGKALEEKAQELWDAEIEAFQARRGARKGSSDSAWLRTVMRNGTLSDRIAAMSMVVQESALHNFSTLTGLIAMTRKRGSREAHLAIEAVRDLFANQLLPDRKLRLFHNNPLGDTDSTTATHLIFWRFEAALAEKYSEYIQSLEEGAQEALPYFKRSCIQAMHELLLKKPEKEKRLLAMLTNKLGDPDRKIGANVVFLLQQLIREHPGMKMVIVDELEALAFRANTSLRAQYYSLVFMTEIPLVRGDDKALAKRMIKLYIRMFKVISDEEREAHMTAKKGGKGSKKKARYAQGRNGKDGNRAKKRGGGRNKNAKKSNGAPVGNSHTKLMRALLQGINRAFAYAECDGTETAEMTDTLFRMVHHATFATGVQALMLLLHVMVARSALSRRFYSTLYSKLFDGQLRTASKHTMFLNVVYKAMKIDTEPKRVLAFAKRLLQTCLTMTSAFTCGVLFLLSEVAKSQPKLLKAMAGVGRHQQRQEKGQGGSDDGSDFENDEDNGEDGSGEGIDPRDINAVYDATKRDPLHAHAEKCMLWELAALADHFHPSVRMFVKNLVEAPHKIVYSGDPLLDFSNPAFLERFSYRNPRQKDLTSIQRQSGVGGGSSAMRPISSGRFGRTSIANPVNSKDFVQQNRGSVRPEEIFFHDFFRSKDQRDRRLGLPSRTGADSNDDKEEEDGDKDGELQSVYSANASKFSDSEDEADLESYSQRLAESIMEDAAGGEPNEEDDDPVFDWSDDSDAGEGSMLDGEMPLGGESGDSDDAEFLNMSDSNDDEDDDDAEEEEEEDLRVRGKRKSGGGTGGGVTHDTFASAEEFADILEASGDKGNKHQIAWERRNDWRGRSGKAPKKRRKFKN
jgi:ribosome biogenesis protein MAK21